MKRLRSRVRTPVVFLPGLLCDARLWEPVVGLLADDAESTIADLTQDDSIAAMAARVLASAPPTFALVGLSMGGYVALEIMRQAPERVTRLALFDTSAAPDTSVRQQERQVGIAALGLGRFIGVNRSMLPRLLHESRVDGPIGGLLQAMAADIGKDGFVRQQTAALGRIDSRPFLKDIKVPTLVCVGENDVLTPPALAEEIHAGIAGSILYVFKACGHLPALEVPEETAGVLRGWLES